VILGAKAAAAATSAGFLEFDDSSASAGNALTIDATAFGSTGTLEVFGGAGDDVMKLATTNFTSKIFFEGGAGNDTIQLVGTTAATIADTAFRNISDVERLVLSDVANTITLSTNARNAMFGETLTIDDTAAGATHALTITATALTSTDNLSILGGAGNDTFTFSATGLGSNISVDGGAGADTITVSGTSSTLTDVAFTHVTHVETLKLQGAGIDSVTLGSFANADADSVGGSLTLDASAFTGTSLTVNAAGMTDNLTVITGAGADNLTGGAGNDVFQFTKAHFDGLATPQTVVGGGGNDTIQITDTTAITIVDNDFLHVSGVESLKIGGTAANSVTLSSKASADVGIGGMLTVDDSAGTGNLTVNGSGMTANLTVIAGTGTTDSLTGGSGNDTFQLTDAHFHGLATPQTIAGGAGNDTLWITDSASFAIGDLDFTNVSGIETFKIGGSGTDTVTLGLKASADAVGVGGMLTLDDTAGTGSLSLDASAMTASLKVLLSSIGNDVLTGGSGDDIFQFNTAPTNGNDHITNFNNTTQHDSFAISASGFAGGGLTAGQDLSQGGVFGSDGTANFGATSERFHFDTATGGLYYSGDGTTAHEVLLATVTNGSTVHASDIHIVT
jgi:Ca2+-binding RTX toxin-like protein